MSKKKKKYVTRSNNSINYNKSPLNFIHDLSLTRRKSDYARWVTRLDCMLSLTGLKMKKVLEVSGIDYSLGFVDTFSAVGRKQTETIEFWYDTGGAVVAMVVEHDAAAT
ncbi:hypothetical protein ACLB2K_055980 [Fragaria x ananassa]